MTRKTASNQFVADMERTGFKVQHCEGRFSWEGSAVVAWGDRVLDHHRPRPVRRAWDSANSASSRAILGS